MRQDFSRPGNHQESGRQQLLIRECVHQLHEHLVSQAHILLHAGKVFLSAMQEARKGVESDAMLAENRGKRECEAVNSG